MKTTAKLMMSAILLAGVTCSWARTQGQAGAASQTPAQPKAGAPAKKGTAAQAGTTAKPAAARSAYDRTLLRPALLKAKAPDTFQVKFTTTQGDFTMTVTRAWSPNGVDRFYNLVKHHYFDDMRVFRVVRSFVAQFGLSSYPAVNAAWANATIKDDPVVQGNKKGFITFAKTGQPNSRSTQLFINLRDNSSFLDSQGFAAFGVLDGDGMKVVEKFYDQYGEALTELQDQIASGGKAFLDKKFPKLDVIKSVALVGDAAAATPAAKPKPAAAEKKPQ